MLHWPAPFIAIVIRKNVANYILAARADPGISLRGRMDSENGASACKGEPQQGPGAKPPLLIQKAC